MFAISDDVTEAGAETDRVRLSRAWVGLGVVLSIGLRLRMYWTPVTTDEGGFIAIARAWGHGKVLYRDVWVDRPQGLLIVFRFWDWIAGGSTASVRIMAMLFGILLVVSVASVATTLVSRRAGAIAAVFIGVTASNPAIEGHIANGELLSGAVAVAGLAVGCIALQRDGRWWVFVASGVLAGCALSIKQSGYEGVVALLLWLVLAIIFKWRSFRDALRAALLISAGCVGVIGVLAIHGALTGWHRWWYAFAGYRLDSRSALKGADWNRFHVTERIARPILGPLVVIIAVGAAGFAVQHIASRVRAPRDAVDRGDGTWVLFALWLIAAAAAFATGGQFHRHYWVTLCPAISAVAAVMLARWVRPHVSVIIATIALLPGAVSAIRILDMSDTQAPVAASDDGRLTANEQLAKWFNANREPDDVMYALCASAAFYADAHEDPPYPYLWEDGVKTVPGALTLLRSLLSSPTGPRYVALYEPPASCDPSGAIAQILANDYVSDGFVAGMEVLERVSRTS